LYGSDSNSSEGIFVLELKVIFLFHHKLLKKSNVANKGAFSVSGWQIREKSVLNGIFRIFLVLGGTENFFPKRNRTQVKLLKNLSRTQAKLL
jgi:hypothetical protein